MRYGLCQVSVAPLRLETSDASEMVSQVLYGEYFKIIDSRKNWFEIRLGHDGYQGWIDRKMVSEIKEDTYNSLASSNKEFCSEFCSPIAHLDRSLSYITLGAMTSSASFLKDSYINGSRLPGVFAKWNIVNDSLKLLNAPYLWGGRSPFGIDCSGFTQLIYRLNGKEIKRDASQQANDGYSLSFVEEAEPGDLAFFDNAEGTITHVGIIMKDNYIIHAHGKVRIDRLDQTGIYNEQENYHSHKLRVIKSL